MAKYIAPPKNPNDKTYRWDFETKKWVICGIKNFMLHWAIKDKEKKQNEL